MHMKSTLLTITFGIVAAASAAQGADLTQATANAGKHAFIYNGEAGDYGAPAKSTLDRSAVLADYAAWRDAGLAQEHAGEQTPDTFSAAYRSKHALDQQWILRKGSQASIAQASERTPTREEVVADAAAWRAAGLQGVWQGEQTPDTNGPAYQQKLATYRQLIGQG